MKFLTPQACYLDLGLLFKMADILSFSKSIKKITKEKKETQASQNRVKFGRTKAEKKLTKMNKKKSEQHISSHKIDD